MQKQERLSLNPTLRQPPGKSTSVRAAWAGKGAVRQDKADGD